MTSGIKRSGQISFASDRIGLLVSVRDAKEAVITQRAGVDLLDIKEPDNGSLGRPDAAVVDSIIDPIQPATPISVALGELNQLTADSIQLFFRRIKGCKRISFAKIGLSHQRNNDNWLATWKSALDAIPIHIHSVAVAYADTDVANSPDVEAVIRAGVKLGCPVLLIDTYSKRGSSVFDILTLNQISQAKSLATKHGMEFVLAGSIGRHQLAAVRNVAPNLVGVRTAVCKLGNRKGLICESAIRSFKTEMQKSVLTI